MALTLRLSEDENKRLKEIVKKDEGCKTGSAMLKKMIQDYPNMLDLIQRLKTDLAHEQVENKKTKRALNDYFKAKNILHGILGRDEV